MSTASTAAAPIVWTDEEVLRVAEAACAVLLHAQAAGEVMGHLPAIRAVQNVVLPAERQRPAITHAGRGVGRKVLDALERRLPELEKAGALPPNPLAAAPTPPTARPARERYGYTPNAKGALRLVADHPGITTAEISALVGWDSTRCAAALLALYKAKGEKRLARIETVSESKRRVMRWYRPEDLPEDVKASRAAAIAEAARIRAEEEARLERRQARAEAAAAAAAEEPERHEDATEPPVAEAVGAAQRRPSLSFPSPRPPGIQALISELAGRLAAQLSEELEVSLLQHIGAMVASLPPAPSSVPDLKAMVAQSVQAVRERARPKVLVVGLLPQQAGMIEQEFGARLDLRFCQASESLAGLKAKIDGVDEAILMANFVDHAHQDIVRHARKWWRLHGGITRLREHLAALVGSVEA